MELKDTKICILVGGPGLEREVSIASGKEVFEYLKKRYSSVISYEISEENYSEKLKLALGGDLSKEHVDVFFNCIHGTFGEDGSLQKILSDNHRFHTSSDEDVSRLTFNKKRTKEIAERLNIPMVKDFMNIKEGLRSCDKIICKPNKEGSSFGITILDQESTVKGFAGDFLIEEYIEGNDITVGILGDEVFDPIKIITQGDWYDYEHKYSTGKTTYEVPANVSSATRKRLREYTQEIYHACGLSNAARCDFLITSTEDIYFLEINSVPGMTSTSLFPKSAQAAGYSFEDLLVKMIDAART